MSSRAAQRPLHGGEGAREGRTAEEEGRDADGVAPVARLDPGCVVAGPPEQPPVLALPVAVGLAALVELSDPVDDGVLVVLDDEPGHLLRRPLRRRCEGAETGDGHLPDPVAVEHLQGAHRQPVGLLEPVRAPEGFAVGHLADDVLFGLAADADLLEHPSPHVGVVLAQDAERGQAFRQLVEDEVVVVLGGMRGRGGHRVGHRRATLVSGPGPSVGCEHGPWPRSPPRAPSTAPTRAPSPSPSRTDV